MIRVMMKKVQDYVAGKDREEILVGLLAEQQRELRGRTPGSAWEESAAGYLLLREMIGAVLPEKKELQGGLSWRKGVHGKPEIPELAPWEFNLSHEGGWVVCAMAEGTVGIDLTKVGPVREAIVKKKFLPEEQEWIRSSEDRELAFAITWAAREALGKWEGSGLSLDPEGYEYDRETGNVSYRGENVCKIEWRCWKDEIGERWVLALCSSAVIE